MRLIRINYFLVFVVSLIFITQLVLNAEGNEKGKRTLQKVTTQNPVSFIDINNVFSPLRNNGISDIDINQQNSGVVFPKGSGKTAVFTSGLLWGARIPGDPQVRVGGTAYATGLQPGAILPNGQADDPTLDKYRIYRVRKDIYPGGPEVDLTNDATIEANSTSSIRAQYEQDWTEWPADMGAPYFDGNENGQYDPDPSSGDIPGVPGSDQTLWFVANDLNASNTADLYGASPMGIEAQVTYWAYNQSGALGNMYFRKYILINKGFQQNTMEDMYVSMWSDVDDGNAGDDFVGVDTVLSLQYCYNAGPTDATYNPLPPPAVGFDFFQGPLVNGVAGEDRNKNGVDDAEDYGIFKGKVVGPGKINLPMTAAYYFANGDPNIGDPPQGDLDGSTQFYNFFQGKYGLSGQTFTNLATGELTTYALSGDPIAGTGWLDGVQLPPGDRRLGSASGPFTLAPGDTQEVVVAEIFAGAIQNVNNISAVGLLKYYDGLAQVAYDNFFELPPNPVAPEVQVAELPNQVNLDWGENVDRVAQTEGYNIIFNEENYKFQGYNVYQLPSASATKDQGQLIATFDLQDQFRVIIGKDFDPNTGQIVLVPQQLGNNTGISHYLEITTDKNTGQPLINGIKYYFAVTAYAVIQSYNKDIPIDQFPLISNVENVISIITVIPQSQKPEEEYVPIGYFTDITHDGNAGGGPKPYIVNPLALTGHQYEVFFTQRQEIRNENGDWVPAGTVRRVHRPNDPDTLTGSSIDIAAVYGTQAGILQLNFALNLVSPDFDYADGITLTFPAGITILSAPSFDAGNGSISPEIVTYADSTVVIMGDISHPYTGNGPFAGGEEWSFTAQGSAPFTVNWHIFDDGYGGGPVDVMGTTTVETVGNQSRLAKYWNLEDKTDGVVKLENQSVLSKNNVFPKRDDIPATQLTNIPETLQPIVDGFRIGVDGTYNSPTTISSSTKPTVNGESVFSFSSSNVWWSSSDGNWRICDFTRFGYANGWAATSLPVYGGAGGTTDVNVLQKDYEFRWTGVLGDTVINGKTLTITKSGGSLITLFGASLYSLADHPLNPSPGVEQRFTVRVPFEVWNVDDNQQVNVLFWDRSGDPTADGGAVWNTTNREYLWIVNTPYTTDAIDETSPDVAANATWNEVFYLSTFTTGDVVRITYDNPIQIGIDTYTFSPAAATFTNYDKAKEEFNKINVFPNPYYGVNSEELNKYNRFVTFSHLPAKATVRIFNLAGVLVKTIEKNDETQFLRWDLANQSGLPVASGLYIAYIEMPDVGTTKILKMAIIQEQQILDRF